MKLREALQGKISDNKVLYIAKMLGYEGKSDQIIKGYNEELEHKDIADNHVEVVKVAMAHLKENPNYYTKLDKCMNTDILEFVEPEKKKEEKKEEKKNNTVTPILVRNKKTRSIYSIDKESWDSKKYEKVDGKTISRNKSLKTKKSRKTS